MNLLKLFRWDELSEIEKAHSLKRPVLGRNPQITEAVQSILGQVRARGDEALKEFTQKWDGVQLDDLKVSAEEIASATIDDDLTRALKDAIGRIRLFHEAQRPVNISIETAPGVRCEKRYRPLERVGLYVPGGTAPLPSTLLMLAIPAQVAGCREVYVMTPPQKDGSVNPVILAAARLLGITQIVKCGGAQAIAALAYGTETLPRVDKIFGPGNAWVTEAKSQVAFDPEGATIDMPAGPSEVLVVADRHARASFVAADLLSQAEHDRASQVILVTDSPDLLRETEKELKTQLADLPRAEIARQALSQSRAFLVRDTAEALEVANAYAPEHLILQIENPRLWSEKVQNAGSVFLGPWTPEAVGDYASGTNHVLPTFGYARSLSGLGLDSFYKSISFQELSKEGLTAIGPTVERLATSENLIAHQRAVRVRLTEQSL